MRIDFGKMVEPMRIEVKTDTQGPQGGKIETWSPFANVMGDLMPTQQRRILADQQSAILWDYEVRIAWLPGIKANIMRVNRYEQAELYLIVAAIDWENRHIAWRLRCQRVQ